MEICQKKEYESLWEHDQLTKERNANRIFSDFNVFIENATNNGNKIYLRKDH